MYYLGIDLGGTNIKAGVVDKDYKVLSFANVKTNCPRPAEEIAADIYKAGTMAVEKAGLTLDDIAEVGVGTPGTVDPKTGFIYYSNNLGFENFPLGEVLKQKFNRNVFFENDANAAAYGELLAGAGKGANDFATVTLGTGVGSGIIVNGKILSGFNFSGGEFGHTVVIKDGIKCTCGRNGCWEVYASANALVRQTKESMLKNKDSKMWEIVGGDIDKTDGRTSFDAMRQGDAAAKEVIDQYCKYIGCGVANLINIFQPEILCIGGGVSKEGETLVGPVREYVATQVYSKHANKQTVIKPAELGNDAGLIGAAYLGNIYR